MRTIAARAGRVAHDEQGAGAPLVLLSANPGDHHHFDAIVPTLARSLRTIALDWPGSGASPAPGPPQSASAMFLADVLEDMVQDLHLESAIFWGNSVGGYAAARLAIRYPQRVRGLILVDSGGFSPPALFIRLFCWFKGREFVTHLFATRWARFYFKRRTPLVRRLIAEIDAGRAIPSRVAVDAAIWRSFNHRDHDLRAAAAQITAPTVLVYGRFDPAIRLYRDGHNVRASIPHAQFVVLETIHEPFAEDPDAFLKALVKALVPFWDSLEDRRHLLHPTRQALVDAGLDLAASAGLNRLTVDAVVNKAGVAKGTFYVHFADRTAFLVALHAQFHERLRDAILLAIAQLPPGAERLRKGTETYLDGCLHERAIKALLLEARSEPPIAAEVQRRNGEFATVAAADFRAMGWPDAEISARFFVILSAEAALVELEAGRSEAARRTLWRFACIGEE